MSRIAKADVNAALKVAANIIVKAGGSDGRTSRAELNAALKTLPKEQKALTDIFFKFIDHRDFKSGAQVTAKDVNRAVAYAKTNMVAKYDLDNNGLSKEEISKMSLTGKRAVDLAKALKGAAVDTDSGLSATKLGQEIAKYADKATYMSEGDYSPEYFAAAFPAGHDLNGHNVMTALEGPLKKMFETTTLNDATFEAYTAAESKSFVNGLSETSVDDDDFIRDSAKAFGQITDLLKANLTDLKVFKIGPKDDRTGKLATDQGLYAQVVIGRTADGKVAGIILGDVET